MTRFTITQLADRLTELATIAFDKGTHIEVHDAAVAEEMLLEEMILLRQATNCREAAAQLALVFGELEEDWTHTDGEAVDRHMKKLARVVASVFGVVAGDLTPKQA